MMRLLTRNLGWKLLSLAIAVALWVAIAREPEVATDTALPIEFKNIPDDLDLSSNLPDRVHVELRGPSGRLTTSYLAGLEIVLDLKDVRPGERTFTIHDYNLNLPSGVSFYRAVPSQLTLRFDRLMTKDVRVIPRYSKPPPDGYRVKNYRVDPPKVTIRGPEDHVTQIEQVLTDPLDLSSIVGNAEFHVHVNVGDPQVRLESATLETVRLQLVKNPQGKAPYEP